MKLIRFIVLVLIVGCAGREKRLIANTCNKESAYANGINQALRERNIKLSSYSVCPEAGRAAYRKAHIDGYEKTQKERRKEAAKNRELAIDLYECTVEAFGKNFSSISRNIREAKAKAMYQCFEKNSQKHCQEVSCIKL